MSPIHFKILKIIADPSVGNSCYMGKIRSGLRRYGHDFSNQKIAYLCNQLYFQGLIDKSTKKSYTVPVCLQDKAYFDHHDLGVYWRVMYKANLENIKAAGVKL